MLDMCYLHVSLQNDGLLGSGTYGVPHNGVPAGKVRWVMAWHF
jgi:hypothetical protein